MRLIDADAVRDALYDADAITMKGVAIINQFPTIEAEPVVHGRWIPTYHTYYNRDGECRIADEWHCSKCNTEGSPFWKRCPVCEAKMDGGEKDV